MQLNLIRFIIKITTRGAENKNLEEWEMKVFYEEILVGTIVTNRSITVDEALELIDFNEESFIEENGFDDIDFNNFRLEY